MAFSPIQSLLAGIASAKVDLMAGFEATYGMEPTNFTIVRTRGRFLLQKTVTGGSFSTVTMGIVNVTEQALAVAGTGALPVPSQSAGADWWYWDQFPMSNIADLGASGLGWTRFEFDISSKRILHRENKTPVLIMENDVAGESVNVRGGIRMLLLGT